MIRKNLPEYIFILLVGSLYIYAVTAGIIAATLIEEPPFYIFIVGFVSLMISICVLYNRRTMLVSFAALHIIALYVWLTKDAWGDTFEYITNVILFINGNLVDPETYGRTVITLMGFLAGFITALFLYKRFNFYVLAAFGMVPFALSGVMNYRKDMNAFLIFMFCFCLLLIRKTNPHRHGVVTALIALPLCLATVAAVRFIPTDRPYTENTMQQVLEKPLNNVYDFFYILFNPQYFSFQSTGFTGAGGRLGGPVALNNRAVMQVEASGRMYLSGATKNSYDGRIWTDTLQEGDLYTGGFAPGHFEMLETAAMLIDITSYNADDSGTRANFASLHRQFGEAGGLLRPGHFPFLSAAVENHSVGFNSLPELYDYMDTLTINSGSVFTQTAETTFEVGLWELDAELNPQIYLLYQSGFVRAYLPLETVYISIDNRTGTVFKPPKGRDLIIYNNNHDYNEHIVISPSGDKRVGELMERFTGYDYEFLQVDTRINFIQEMLHRSHRGYYQPMGEPVSAETFDGLHRAFVYDDLHDWQPQTVYKDYAAILRGFISEPLYRYAESVYEHYTALPDTVPQRVYDLANEITLHTQTDYEKALAIEAYLLSIPYTLNPPPVPAGADFVDWFLFEAQEGYCTYYASAMAVLCRMLGIPARYVEGYLTPPQQEQGWYTVTNANAHAWAEIYLEGYGWLIMEATAPFRHANDRRPATGGSGGGSMFAESFMGYRSYEEYMRSIGLNVDGMPPDFFWPESVLRAMDAPEEEPFTFNRAHGFIFIFSLILLGFIYLWLQMISEKHRRWRMGKMPVNRQAQYYFKSIIRMTRYYRYPMLENETPQAYGVRLGKRFAFKSDTKFLRDLVVLYYKARYGDKPLTEKELDLMKEAHEDMCRLLRNVFIKPRFMFIRYVRKITRA